MSARIAALAVALPAAALVAYWVRRRMQHPGDAVVVAAMLRAIEHGMYLQKSVLNEFLSCCFELAADDPAAPVLQRAVAICTKLGGDELRAAAAASDDDHIDGTALAALLQPLARVQELAALLEYGTEGRPTVQVCRVPRCALVIDEASIADLPLASHHEEEHHERSMEGKLERLRELVVGLGAEGGSSTGDSFSKSRGGSSGAAGANAAGSSAGGAPGLARSRAEMLEIVAEIQQEEATVRKVAVARALSAFQAAAKRQRSKKGAEFLGAMGLYRDSSTTSRSSRDSAANSRFELRDSAAQFLLRRHSIDDK